MYKLTTTLAVTLTVPIILGMITAVYAQENAQVTSNRMTPNGQEVCYSNGDCWLIHGNTACQENTNPLNCINVANP
jgi:hypothetical protein